jgi:hypothetical protein
MSVLKKEDLLYLAGFIDGDGCILAQIVKRDDYKFQFQIRVSIMLYQKTSRHWFLLQWLNILNMGSLRKKNDSMSELAIVGTTPVKKLLLQLLPYLIIKKPTAKLVLEIIENLDKINNRSDFIEVCKLVDKVAEHTDSKKRTITTEYVLKYYSDNNSSS